MLTDASTADRDLGGENRRPPLAPHVVDLCTSTGSTTSSQTRRQVAPPQAQRCGNGRDSKETPPVARQGKAMRWGDVDGSLGFLSHLSRLRLVEIFQVDDETSPELSFG
ncbi:hypothetical protein J3458_019759 [Metarhizium acridum]|uniref:uncharacterized protein n=1 Tax=Metarhizium acridum TaxID=92637 RepID=UPI001C6A9134|nr:hypothetical protein J3458_019759 [Metarhizium acridum]